MLAEHPTPPPVADLVETALDDAIVGPIDVVVLVAPDHDSLSQEFVDVIAEVRRRGDVAVLVVFPHVVDTDVIQRARAAGASHCAVAPTPDDLFRHVEHARARRRHESLEDDPLDALWRARTLER